MAVLWHDDGSAIGNCGNVFVNVWRQHGGMVRLAKVRTLLDDMVVRHPKGFGQITVLEPTTLEESISAAERDEAAAMSKHYARHTLALAYVFEGDGFRAAAARMILSGIHLIARVDYPNRIFSTVPPATRWLTEYVAGVDPERVAATVEELRLLIR